MMTSKVVHTEGDCKIEVREKVVSETTSAGVIIAGLTYIMSTTLTSCTVVAFAAPPVTYGYVMWFNVFMAMLISAFVTMGILLVIAGVCEGMRWGPVFDKDIHVYEISVSRGSTSTHPTVTVVKTFSEEADREAICAEVRKLIPVAKTHAAEIEQFNRVANCNKPVKED